MVRKTTTDLVESLFIGQNGFLQFCERHDILYIVTTGLANLTPTIFVIIDKRGSGYGGCSSVG